MNLLIDNINLIIQIRYGTRRALSNATGIDYDTLTNWNRGTARPSIEDLIKISDDSNIPIDDMVRRSLTKIEIAAYEMDLHTTLSDRRKHGILSRLEVLKSLIANE